MTGAATSLPLFRLPREETRPRFGPTRKPSLKWVCHKVTVSARESDSKERSNERRKERVRHKVTESARESER